MYAIRSYYGFTAEKPSKKEIQHNMQDYLETKYDKEFVVNRPSLKGNEGFGYNSYLSDAYTKEEPRVEFQISWNKSVDEYLERNNFV